MNEPVKIILRQKDTKIEQRNRIKCPKIDPHLFWLLVVNKVFKDIQGEKQSILTNGAKKWLSIWTNLPHCKL